MSVNLVNRVKTRSRRSGYEQVATGPKGHVVGRNARLQSSKYKNLTVGSNLEDGPIAISDVKIFGSVEGNSGRDPHTLGICGHSSISRHPINFFIMAG